MRLSYVPFLAAPFLVIGAAPFLCPSRHTTFGLALQRFEEVADSVHPTAAPDAGWSTCMSMLRFTRNRAAGVAQLIGSASPLSSSVSIWRAEGRYRAGRSARRERHS